jgi:hypothetical protein
MDATELWNQLNERWWWIHALLLGLSLGGSLGIWAYRELWYGLSTFFASPVETRSPFRAIVQWLASFVMLVRSGITVALIVTFPFVLRNQTPQDNRWIAVGIAVAVWLLFRLLFLFGFTRKPAPPTFFKRPFRWAYYRSVQSPDSLVTDWVDVLLGVLLHAGLVFLWYEYRLLGEPTDWRRAAMIGAAVGMILLATSITVLIHPTPNKHNSEPDPYE